MRKNSCADFFGKFFICEALIERAMGYYLTAFGLLAILAGAVFLLMGNRARSRMNGQQGSAKSMFTGPVWFLFIVLGIFLFAISPFFQF